MIKIKEFIVTSKNRVHKESCNEVKILPQHGGVFEFLERKDLDEFKDQLRQAFEFVLVFGCEVYSFEQKYATCGGCGATDPEQRCIGCRHDFSPNQPI